MCACMCHALKIHNFLANYIPSLTIQINICMHYSTHRSSTLSTLELHVDHPCPAAITPLPAGVHQPQCPSLPFNDIASHEAKGLSGNLTAIAIATGTHTRPLGTLAQFSEVKGPASWLR